jgi:hypothetical protein
MEYPLTGIPIQGRNMNTGREQQYHPGRAELESIDIYLPQKKSGCRHFYGCREGEGR